METQNVIIEVRQGSKKASETIQIPSNETLVKAAIDLRSIGENKSPAAKCCGHCIGIYIPSRNYFTTETDPFTGKQGKTIKSGTITELCIFYFGAETLVADTMYQDNPPKIYYYCKQTLENQLDLFDQASACLDEGTPYSCESTVYERNPTLRKLCIQHHGTQCAICKMSFEGIYGDAAIGYIHVHHLVPLSTMMDAHQVNPVKDLLPVCPNCHAVIHLKDPPYTPDQVRNMLR